MDSHVEHVVSSLVRASPSAPPAAALDALTTSLRRLLEAAVSDDILLREEALRQLVERPDVSPCSPIRCVRLTTYKEPTALAEFVRTCELHLRRFDRRLTVVALDDDRQVAPAQVALAALEDAQPHVSVVRAMSCDLGDYCTALAQESGVARDVVAFGLMPDESLRRTDGACKNALMLDGVGERYLQFDDDIQWRTGGRGVNAGPLRFYAGQEPLHTRYCRDRNDVVTRAPWSELDVVGEHEEVLAKSIPDVIGLTQAAGLPSFEGPVVPHLAGLIRGQSCRIRATFTGLAGDPATEFPSYRTLLDHSRSAFIESEETYTALRLTREVVRAAPCLTVIRPAWAMAFAMGCDATDLLPPFFPLGRSYERAFSALLGSCWPNAFTAVLPMFVLHAPSRPRTFGPDAMWRGTVTLRLPDLAALLIQTIKLGNGGEPEQRLRKVGRELEDIGALDDEECSDVICSALFVQRSELLKRHYDTLDAYKGEPNWWAIDLRRQIQCLEEQLKTTRVPHLEDYGGLIQPGHLKGLRNLIGRYGQFVSAWPSLFRAAQTLKQRGRSLADLPARRRSQ